MLGINGHLNITSVQEKAASNKRIFEKVVSGWRVVRPRGWFAEGWQGGASLRVTSRHPQNHLPQGECDGNRYARTQYTFT
jgi:hypothetical protein